MTFGNWVSLAGALITVVSVIRTVAPQGLRELAASGVRRLPLRMWQTIRPKTASGGGVAEVRITATGAGIAIRPGDSRFPDPASHTVEFLVQLEREIDTLRVTTVGDLTRERAERERALAELRSELEREIERVAVEVQQANLSGLRGQFWGASLVILGVVVDYVQKALGG